MTAFDIYSAVGSVGEDILEESETVPKKKITKIIPLMAAAACFAVFAFGISHALRNDNIEQPVTDISNMTTEVTAADTYPAETDLDGTADVGGDVTLNALTSLDPQITGDGIVIYDPKAQTTSVSLFNAETVQIQTDGQTQTAYTAVTEETTLNFTTSDIPEDVEEEEVECVGVPKWEDLSDLEKYVYLEYNGNEYNLTLKHFNGNELTFLQNGRLYGLVGSEKRYSDPCVFYKINNISPDYMIAVLTADGKYRGFENTSYCAETLADHLAETDFLKYVDEGKVVAISDDTDRKITNYTLDDLPAAVRKLMSAAPDAYPLYGMPYDPSDVPKCYSLRRSNGITFMHVYDDGSIYIYDR